MMHQPVQEEAWSPEEIAPSDYPSVAPQTTMANHQSANIGDLMTALAKAQGEIGDIERDRTVKVQSRAGGSYEFSYATLAAIIKGIKKPLSDNGISYTQVINYNDGDRLYYLTTSLHFKNQWIASVCPLIIQHEGNQQFGSAATYMKRYTLAALVGVAAEEDDDANAADGNQVKEMKPRVAPDPIKNPEHYNQNVAVGVGEPKKAPELPKIPEPTKEMVKEYFKPEGNPLIRKIDVELMEDGEQHDWMGWGKEFIASARSLNNAKELAEFEKVNATPLKNMEISAPRMFSNLSVSLIKVRKTFEARP